MTTEHTLASMAETVLADLVDHCCEQTHVHGQFTDITYHQVRDDFDICAQLHTELDQPEEPWSDPA